MPKRNTALLLRTLVAGETFAFAVWLVLYTSYWLLAPFSVILYNNQGTTYIFIRNEVANNLGDYEKF